MTTTEMTSTDVELARGEVIATMEDLQLNFGNLLEKLRCFHPLNPPSAIRDRLYEGLSKEDEDILRDEIRAYLAGALVVAIWMGLAKGSGDVAGASQTFVRERMKDALSEHGSKGEAMVEQLKRFATIVEQAEARRRRAKPERG